MTVVRAISERKAVSPLGVLGRTETCQPYMERRYVIHEMSIAAEIYRACRTEADARLGGRLEEVRVAVGELSAVEPNLLRFAWEAVVAEGGDAHARLEVEWHRVSQRCPDCGEVKEPQTGSWMRLCPCCGGPLRLEGGRELDILSISFEVDEDEDELRVARSAVDPA